MTTTTTTPGDDYLLHCSGSASTAETTTAAAAATSSRYGSMMDSPKPRLSPIGMAGALGNSSTNHMNHHPNTDHSTSCDYDPADTACCGAIRLPSLRRLALELSLYLNVAITLSKLVAYIQTLSLSVLAALLDSVLDVVSQIVLNYTERHSGMQRSSALYPAGAARLEPIGVLTCAALMGMASFEVLKESGVALAGGQQDHDFLPSTVSVYNMLAIVVIKLGLLWLCRSGAHKRRVPRRRAKKSHSQRLLMLAKNNNNMSEHHPHHHGDDGSCSVVSDDATNATSLTQEEEKQRLLSMLNPVDSNNKGPSRHVVQLADPTLEALAQDHWNDALSNGVAALALACAVHKPSLWFLDPIGAILISLYIIYSWYTTGKEQIEHLTGKGAPAQFIEELEELAGEFDDRLTVDVVRAYHFGPKFLVEIEIVMDAATLLFESHDVGMDLQYEIEGREEVERCFVHIDYQERDYDEHVVSKVPELREKYCKNAKPPFQSAQSV